MNACLSTVFAMSYPYSIFTEPNMMVVRLRGATSLWDSKCSNLWAQWMSSSPLIRARLLEAMDHAALLAVHKTKVQTIRTHAEALFPAPYLIGLRLELGAPRSRVRELSDYVTRRGDAYVACTGLPLPRPIPTRDQFDATWKSLTALLALSRRLPMGHRHGHHRGQGMVALGKIWAEVLQVCGLHFRVHMLFIIRAFKIRKLPS